MSLGGSRGEDGGNLLDLFQVRVGRGWNNDPSNEQKDLNSDERQMPRGENIPNPQQERHATIIAEFDVSFVKTGVTVLGEYRRGWVDATSDAERREGKVCGKFPEVTGRQFQPPTGFAKRCGQMYGCEHHGGTPQVIF